MPRIRFHRLVAIIVLAASVAWVASGDFSFVGSANGLKADEDAGKAAEKPPVAEPSAAPLRTIAFVQPAFSEHERTIRISGQTQADKRSVLATRTAGVIGDLPVVQGQRVAENEIILSIDGSANLATVETAKAVLQQRQREADAAEKLVKQGSLPSLQADNARSALAAAQSELERAQADVDNLQIKAPFPGVVDRISVEKGSWVMEGTEAAVLISLDPIIATGEVSERDLGFLTIGEGAEIVLVDGTAVEGKIRYISREATEQTRTFPVEIEIPNRNGIIPAGMTAEIKLRASPVQAIVLPRSVVTLSEDGDLGVRILEPDDIVAFVAVDLIDDTANGLVLAGIPEDARVIVAGQDLVSEGETVNAVKADAGTIPAAIETVR